MTDLTIFPADLAAMSVSDLASLPPAQKAEISRNLNEAQDWLKAARTKFDAALDAAYGEQARVALRESGRDFGTTHVSDGPLRITFELPRRVSWDQQRLSEMAARITAAGERVPDYLDVELSIPESRFSNWPPSLREQFAPARTAKPGKPAFRLALLDDLGA
ncbi:hypothetical protein [Burkholderia pseudomallei]|uniref:hypothetical protein n=1 Tax=Burkholderia pseudomallei TaxID=28450 RepID=UPI000A1A1873|nr:hypothetical protein [Burkholderia pseudomallei]ARK50057.1 hypothetical protein BOC35_28745 [Burkholderia pseudomallei]